MDDISFSQIFGSILVIVMWVLSVVVALRIGEVQGYDKCLKSIRKHKADRRQHMKQKADNKKPVDCEVDYIYGADRR